MEDVIARWEKKHPGLSVEWIDLPFSAIQQKLIAAIVSGEPPSVINLNTDMARQLAESGILLNLNEAVSREERGRYYPGFWSPHAFPWYVTTEVLIYNKAIFQQAGLDPNKPPKTWDELVQDAKIIKEKTGLYGWFPAIKFIQELQEQGIPVVDSTGKKALFDQPPAVAWLSMYVDLFQQGIIPRETLDLSKTYQQAVDLYQAGRLGILQTGPQFLNRVRNEAPSVYQETQVAPLPLGKGKVISAAIMNLVIPKNAPHQKEAVDFALFLTNDENQLAFSHQVLVFPSTIKASEDSYFHASTGDSVLDTARRIGADELKIARELTPDLPNAKPRNEAIQAALENALLGRKSPGAALHDAAMMWDDLLK